MNNIKFRTLYPNEIEVRPHPKAKNSDTKILLLYIDSRAVTTLLDETVGNLNWKNEFYEAGGLLFNKLSIRHPETGEWISRSDTGSESTIEENKGKVSDTFKRCLTRFGVTELYSKPKIEIKDDGYGCTGYKVSDIAYDDNRKITHLVIVNRFGKEMVRWNANTQQPRQPQQPVQAPIQPNTAPRQPQAVPQPQQYDKNVTILVDYCRETKAKLVSENKPVEALNDFYRHYEPKVKTWRTVNPEKLWMEWTSRLSAR